MKRQIIAVAIAVAFLAVASLIVLPDYESPRIIKFIIISQVMFALSVVLFVIVRRMDFEQHHRRLFGLLIVIALITRVTLLIGAGEYAHISDDVYRYVWDGKVNAHGINPYLYGPLEPEVSHLADSTIHPNINHPWLPTIYPPMAQNIFLAAYALDGDSIRGFKLIAAIFEILSALALFVWLRVTGIPRTHIILWMYSPLILIEFYLSTHLDILGLPFLVGSLIAFHQRRPLPAGLLLALATLVKFYGLFLLPFFFIGLGRKLRLRFSLAFVGTVVALYLPYTVGAGDAVFGSLFEYLSSWQFNGSVFILLKYIVELEYARIVVAALFVGWVSWLLVCRWSPFDRMFAVLGGYLILTPTFFPWYFVWIFPFLLRNLSWAFLFLSGSVLLSYHVFIGKFAFGQWSVIPWLGALEYVPFFILLALEVSLRKTNRVSCA